MISYLNGHFVPAEQATVSVFDRGFLYGDGLFETLRVDGGEPRFWDLHFARLARGAKALRIRLPADSPDLLQVALELLRKNHLSEAILRIALTRGLGPRGYSIRGAETPTLVVTVHSFPPSLGQSSRPWRLHTASVRLPAGDPFAAYKTNSKLLHVMARQEAEEAGADEALLLNTAGHITEAAAANLFWLQNDDWFTPHLETGALAGVTRALVLRLIRDAGWNCAEVSEGRKTLDSATGIFLTFSTLGILEVSSLDGQMRSPNLRIAKLREAYECLARQARPPCLCD